LIREWKSHLSTKERVPKKKRKKDKPGKIVVIHKQKPLRRRWVGKKTYEEGGRTAEKATTGKVLKNLKHRLDSETAGQGGVKGKNGPAEMLEKKVY